MTEEFPRFVSWHDDYTKWQDFNQKYITDIRAEAIDQSHLQEAVDKKSYAELPCIVYEGKVTVMKTSRTSSLEEVKEHIKNLSVLYMVWSVEDNGNTMYYVRGAE